MIQQNYEFWFITGSQYLYGEDVLVQVAEHSKEMVAYFNDKLAYPVQFKEVVKEPDEIYQICQEANNDESCAGVITWMHTFSPAKMWIRGLSALQKPLLHLHTQFNRDIPWDTIDMDFMNLNQAAHGDREFAHLLSRLKLNNKTIAGYWKNKEVLARISSWMQTAIAFNESQGLRIARFGDNMRQVAVTEGDKVEAQVKLGWTIDGYGVGDLVERMRDISEQQVKELVDEYEETYEIPDKSSYSLKAIKYQARTELALLSFLEEGGYTAFTNTFEDLHGMRQLPGLATQRLMEKGYGYGGEGDWKTAGLVRLMKIMAKGQGTTFMEDYTYHLEEGKEMILGAHMLEVCPTIAEDKPRIEVHPLSIGGKEDPARLVFNGAPGKAVNASLVDLGTRFRLLVQEVEAVKIEQAMPKLPVARVLWKVEPSFTQGVENWLLAGGAHHTSFSYHVTTEQLVDLGKLLGIEVVTIDRDTIPHLLEKELRLNEIYYQLLAR